MARCVKESGGICLELESNEADLLRFVGRELRRLLEHGEDGGQKLTAFSPKRQRERDAEAMVGDLDPTMELELLHHRLKRIETVQEELFPGSDVDQDLTLNLDDTQCDIWLAYLADLRLLLAEVIGIHQENPDPFEQDPEEWTLEMQMYHFLSVIQEWILDALE